MKRSTCALAFACCVLAASAVSAITITPIEIAATSQWGDAPLSDVPQNVFVTSLIDGSGLSDPPDVSTPDDVLDDLHDNHPDSENAWYTGSQTAGIEGGEGDPALPENAPLISEQIIEFDFGQIVAIDDLYIWQQNQGGAFGAVAPLRGLNEFELTASLEPFVPSDGVQERPLVDESFTSIGIFTLAAEAGTQAVPAQVIELAETVNAHRMRFNLMSAHSGIAASFVGLSEVRFVGDDPAPLPGDYNFDFTVNAPDYNVWRDSFGDQGEGLAADGNGDLEINAPDYNIWRDNFGLTLNNGDGNSAVPEPSTALLLLASLALTVSRRSPRVD